MTTKAQTRKTSTAAAVSAAFKTAASDLVTAIQVGIDNKQAMAECVARMRKTKVVFGKSRATCAMLSYVYEELGKLKTAKGQPLAEGTRNDYLTAIKKAVTTGEELNLNSRRKPKPAGQSQTPAKKDKAKLTAKGKDSDKTVAEKIAILLESVINLASNDETPEGYDPVEIQTLVKQALSLIK